MAFVETTAATTLDLFDAIVNFADDQGFTINWNTTANNGQVGISKPGNNFFLAFGRRISNPEISRNMLFSGGTRIDTHIFATLATAFSATQTYAGGHTGAPGGTGAVSQEHAISNDWYGAFSNVWLFSDPGGNYVHVVTRTGNSFGYFSFGLIDNMGFSGDRPCYVTGMFYEFWEKNASPTNNAYAPNRPQLGGSNWNSTGAIQGTGHYYPFGLGTNGGSLVHWDYMSQLYMPANVIDNALFPGVGGTVVNRPISTMNVMDFSTSTPSAPRMLGGIFNGRMTAMSTTIGRPMLDLPVIWGAGGAFHYGAPFQMLGRYPDVRFVWLDGLNPGQVIDINGDPWIVFPFKQKGAPSAVAVEPGNNTWDYGLAFRIFD